MISNTLKDSPLHFLVIGAGGTTSWMFRSLVNEVVSLAKKNTSNEYSITLADGDIVETKNLRRQAFAIKDIGENKAQVLVSRIPSLLPSNVKVNAIPYFLVSENDPDIESYTVNKFFMPYNENTFYIDGSILIVLSLGDNNQIRKSMYETLKSYNGPYVLINAGNTEHNGQCVVEGNIFGSEAKSFYELFPEIYEHNDKLKSGPSCADLPVEENTVFGEQNVEANFLNSRLVLSAISRLINGKVFNNLNSFLVRKSSYHNERTTWVVNNSHLYETT